MQSSAAYHNACFAVNVVSVNTNSLSPIMHRLHTAYSFSVTLQTAPIFKLTHISSQFYRDLMTAHHIWNHSILNFTHCSVF